jgi:hypothetical protein
MAAIGTVALIGSQKSKKAQPIVWFGGHVLFVPLFVLNEHRQQYECFLMFWVA